MVTIHLFTFLSWPTDISLWATSISGNDSMHMNVHKAVAVRVCMYLSSAAHKCQNESTEYTCSWNFHSLAINRRVFGILPLCITYGRGIHRLLCRSPTQTRWLDRVSLSLPSTSAKLCALPLGYLSQQKGG